MRANEPRLFAGAIINPRCEVCGGFLEGSRPCPLAHDEPLTWEGSD